jgi:hypothetical protein
VSCAATGLCVAVDYDGNVVTSTNPTGGAAAWKVTKVDPAGGLQGVSCPSTSSGVAVDINGNVVASTNPAGGASAWKVTHVVGGSSQVGGLSGVSCPSIALCVAVAQNGYVIASTNPAGGGCGVEGGLPGQPCCVRSVLSQQQPLRRGGRQPRCGHLQQPHRGCGGLESDQRGRYQLLAWRVLFWQRPLFCRGRHRRRGHRTTNPVASSTNPDFRFRSDLTVAEPFITIRGCTLD